MCHERRRIIGQVDEKQKDSVQCEGGGRKSGTNKNKTCRKNT